MKKIEVRPITSWLSMLKSKQWDYFGTRHFRDNGFKPDTVNPCPEFINQKRLWMHLGTFTDYMIRKFFRDNLISSDAEIVLEEYLISEISLRQLYYEDNKATMVLGSTEEEIQNSLKLYKNGTTWINNYKNRNWKDVIHGTWLMSDLDALYRSGHFPQIKPLEEYEIKEMTIFLENTLEWLQKTFNSAKKIYLNPTLGISNFVKADADLIIDNSLLDIKTTKHPNKAPNNEVNQLLLYTSLCYYNSIKKLQDFPVIDKIAFIFPQQLTLWERDLHDFKINERENMISKLKNLSEGKSIVI